MQFSAFITKLDNAEKQRKQGKGHKKMTFNSGL